MIRVSECNPYNFACVLLMYPAHCPLEFAGRAVGLQKNGLVLSC